MSFVVFSQNGNGLFADLEVEKVLLKMTPGVIHKLINCDFKH
jgi:hypothetical protein